LLSPRLAANLVFDDERYQSAVELLEELLAAEPLRLVIEP
jgi:hypothetical protein